MNYPLEAERLHSGKWVVRPKNQLGTCGYYPQAWRAVFLKARTSQEAITKAFQRVWKG